MQYSRTFALQVQTSWNQAHAPLLVESFPKTPRAQSKASRFGGSHNYKKKTKQTNYLPSQIDNTMHHSSWRAFQRHQEHNLKHRGSVDLITTKTKKTKKNKTNYLPS
jgi:hypothetical protein